MAELWEEVFVLVLIVIMLVALYKDVKSPEIIVFTCMISTWLAGIISTKEALTGFSNAGMLAVGALFVVVKGVEQSGIVERAARHVFGLKTSMRMGLLRMQLMCFGVSAFLNNTPIVALFIPIVRDWARLRGFYPSYFLIPLSFATILGGCVTTIGTSTNLVVQGLLSDYNLETFSFFDPAKISIPVGIICIIYMNFAGPLLLKPRAGLFRDVRDRAQDMLTELEVSEGCPLIGKPVSVACSRLGVPPETIFKIRRPVRQETLQIIEETNRRQRSMSKEVIPAGSNNVFSPVPKRAKVGGTNSSSFEAMDEAGEVGKAVMLNAEKTQYEVEMGKVWGESQHPGTPEEAMIHRNIKEKRSGPESMHLTSDMDKSKDSSSGGAMSSSGVTLSSLQRRRPGGGSGGGGAGVTFEESTETKMDDGSDTAGEVVGYIDEYPVMPSSVIQSGDQLFLSCSTKVMMTLQNTTAKSRMTGLKIMDVHATNLVGKGTEYMELVLSSRNHFIDRPVNDRDFSKFYDCTVLSMRRPGEATTTAAMLHVKSFRVAAKSRSKDFDQADSHGGGGGASAAVGEDVNEADDDDAAVAGEEENSDEDERTRAERDVEVTSRTFSPGYTLLVLAKKDFYQRWFSSGDFLLITKVGAVPAVTTWWDYIPIGWFAFMLVWVAAFDTDMVKASMAIGVVMIMGGWIDAKAATSYIDWGLLMLIGSAIGISKSIENSGLADAIGNEIAASGISAYWCVWLMYAFTALITELITNNAAASLSIPLAVSIADKLGVDYKPFAMVVMLAASASFLTPIGYQTNTMVWGPGGYNFIDFPKIGAPMTCITMAVTCSLVTLFWPL